MTWAANNRIFIIDHIGPELSFSPFSPIFESLSHWGVTIDCLASSVLYLPLCTGPLPPESLKGEDIEYIIWPLAAFAFSALPHRFPWANFQRKVNAWEASAVLSTCMHKRWGIFCGKGLLSGYKLNMLSNGATAFIGHSRSRFTHAEYNKEWLNYKIMSTDCRWK